MPRINIERTSENEENKMKTIRINELLGRVCYFSLSGDLALEAFSRIKFSSFNEEQRRERLKYAFTQRLYFAITMFDKVVMHCSDPLRSDIVLEVLEEHIEWIQMGYIVFVFSKHITDIENDYKNYIDDKIKEYMEGFCSEKEASSLKPKHADLKYYERVITLLKNTQYLVRKPDEPQYSFDKLVVNDLDPQTQPENVIIDSSAHLSQILSLNLSLIQLLRMRHLGCREDEEKEVGKFVFPQEMVNSVIEDIRICLEQGNTIARSAIVDSLEEEFNKNQINITKVQKNVLKAITLRMDILYCKMNSGEKLILEFHPSYEDRSNYQIDCFKEYLKIITAKDKEISLTQQITNKILHNKGLNCFRVGFFVCMADTREYMKLTQFNGNNSGETLLKLFNAVAKQNKKIIKVKPLNSIVTILKEEI